ncbi:MAG: RNA polymerase sigma factor [Lachnospiraceae bacterium]|jgi:RNA polymerase sigma factor, sigma-70 family|uniref:RNA polymerase sigma factor n=1 Tax=Roseburia sp. 1XD42-69 TaxID=2320088 RepID=UPI000EA0D0A1|nr:RNA polymerase sigma factor [Roseburia sp. 1XD42-69]MCI8875477.1 RNA polymerase sigma factor [Lachnospiraceae bacterium]MCX4319863.1 RNA polymerase sigma factor [Lachnospiraceae bacterium]RKJ62801.1 RNA polymerase sigma factor [Roseburia sp. 1XD42-69]
MDKETFAGLVIDSTDSLYRVSKSILKNDADCEDAVSEAIVKAFGNLASLKKDKHAKTWLTRILINECFHIRKQRKKVTLLSEEDAWVLERREENSGNLLEVERYSELYHFIGKLKENQRLAVILYYYEGYSVKEIASIMEVTQGTVKSRLGRARKILKQYLEEGYYV